MQFILLLFFGTNGGFPLQSAPGIDVDIFTARMAAADENMLLQSTYNLEAPNEMIQGFKARLPAMTSAVTNFGDKYGICGALKGLKTTVIQALDEAFTVASSHAPELSQLSVLFRNVVVQYQKSIQSLLNAAVRFLRETQIKLPGMEETTLPEICKKVKRSIILVFEQIITAVSTNLDTYVSPIIQNIRSVQVTLPSGKVLTVNQIMDHVKKTLKSLLTRIVKVVKKVETLDMILEKLGATLQGVVETAQEFVDTIRSDVLDSVVLYINQYYTYLTTLVKELINQADALLTIDQFNAIVEQCIDSVLFILNKLTNAVSIIFPVESEYLVNVQDGRLEIKLPFPSRQ